jgi:Holliday junction resolvase RusA-like endonuclease
MSAFVDHALTLADEIDALGQSAPRAYCVVIPGKPVGKARARFGAGGRTFTPETTRNAEAWARGCILEQVGRPMLDGPLALEIDVVQPVPASWSKRKQAAALAGTIHPTGRPDFDNLAKLACDAANTLLWKDDAQVVRALIRKRYGAEPQTILRVQPLPEAPAP